MSEYYSAGEVLTFDFGRQQSNFQGLLKALSRNNMAFTHMNLDRLSGYNTGKYSLHKPNGRTVITFRVFSPALEWFKYESGGTGAGQNWVYIHGKQVKLTEFLGWEDAKQDAVLQDPMYFKNIAATNKVRNKANAKKLLEIAKQHNWQLHIKGANSTHYGIFAFLTAMGDRDLRESDTYATIDSRQKLKSMGKEWSFDLTPEQHKIAYAARDAHNALKEAMASEIATILGDDYLINTNYASELIRISI